MDNNKGIENLSDFRQSMLNFSYTGNGFFHNFNRDIQFVVLWENGRYKEQEIVSEISKKFNILYCANITWSDIHKRNNFNRLYSQRLGSKANLKKHQRVGMGDFLCIVFEDLNPKYNYLQSLSGDVFIGNVNVVNMKYNLRELLGDNLLHSTSGISEFFHHASLIFHEYKLKEIIDLRRWDNHIHQLNQDLAGAEGWSSFEEMIKIANYCSNWVILRNQEYLPFDFWGNDKDLDILCGNLSIFSSAINATKRKGNISAYETKIEGKKVPVDIRFVGDCYYDPVWEDKMLNRKSYKNIIVPALRDDDYFFSLLYHAKLQKPKVKDVYIPRLVELGQKLGITDINREFILDNERTGKMINGFLNEQSFYFYQPHDRNVFLNKEVLQFISARPIYGEIPLKNKVLKNIARMTPTFIKKGIPKSFKNKLKR